jgi:LacI family transcriptional regulator
MTTIKDIAKAAGVGLGTVSRALNGEPNIRPDTRDRILTVAWKLGYRPNEAARQLARGGFSSTTIGVVLPSIIHPFYFEILRGIHSAFSEIDKNMMVFNLGAYEELVVGHIAKENLAGIIVVAAGISHDSLSHLNAQNTNVVFLDRHEDHAVSFWIDNMLGGSLAAKYLVSAGCGKIAYIGDSGESQQQDDRLHGFRTELSRAGKTLSNETYIHIDEKTAYNAAAAVLQSGGIDGVFCFCDRIAYGVMQYMKEQSISARIIGYDDAPASQYLGLSSVRQPAFEMGYDGAMTVANYSKKDKPKSRVFLPVVVDRGS